MWKEFTEHSMRCKAFTKLKTIENTGLDEKIHLRARRKAHTVLLNYRSRQGQYRSFIILNPRLSDI